MKLIAILTMLILFGCGSNTVTVTYNEVSKEELKAWCLNPLTCTGYAEWNAITDTCTIWMTSKESYGNISNYHEVLGHEMRHCLEGEFHE